MMTQSYHLHSARAMIAISGDGDLHQATNDIYLNRGVNIIGINLNGLQTRRSGRSQKDK
ncbi:hypothetical protein NIASO_09265 [Niabella soli DSM 19437]|uniref:NYN domain-containing protein n=1 Tax=Niabella soli DSM 19437 TaxID=929713 RepID=W0F828_9BACT|nr:hypothetical protein NIASO_09265 [Niabella soli DSM 19437]